MTKTWVVRHLAIVALVALASTALWVTSTGSGQAAEAPPALTQESAGTPPSSGDICQTFDINLNSSMTGRLPRENCEHHYYLELTSQTTIIIDLESDDFDAYLRLDDNWGRKITHDDNSGLGSNARITRNLDAAWYEIIVISVADEGSYEVTVTGSTGAPPAPAPAPSPSKWELIATGSPSSGGRVEHACNAIYCEDRIFGTNEYFDGSTATITAQPNSGYRFSHWTGAASGSSNPTAVYMNQDKSATAHFERISSGSPPPPSCTTTDISTSSSRTGSLSSSDCRDPRNSSAYADLYRFRVTSTAEVTIDLTSNDFDAFLRLLNANGSQISEDDDGGGNRNSRIAQTLTPGTYQIVATIYGGFSSAGGGYRLDISTLATRYTLTATADPSNGDGGHVEIEGGSRVRDGAKSFTPGEQARVIAHTNAGWRFVRWSGAASGSSARTTVRMDRDKQVTAHWERVATPKHTLTVTISPNGSGYVVANGISDGGAMRVQFDRGQTVGLSAVPSEGWRFDRWSGAATGSWPETQVYMDRNRSVTAHFERLASPTSTGSTAITDLTIPTGLTGSLAYGDRRDPRDSNDYADIYRFTLTRRSEVTIEMESTAFNAFLRLLDADGIQRAYDNNGGNGTNSRIRRTLSAGTYQIVATEASNRRATGTYSLRLGDDNVGTRISDILVEPRPCSPPEDLGPLTLNPPESALES